jgi:hypothetical protein
MVVDTQHEIVLKTPRELLRRHYQELFELKSQEIPSGPLEGQRVVLWDDIRWALGEPFPPASDHGAEVATPARVVVWAACPRCGISAPVAVELRPELRVDDHSGALHVKAKAKPASHSCGQLTLDGPEGQGSFELEDIIGDDSDAFALGDIVRVQDGGAGDLIGPIVRFETDEEIAAADAEVGEVLNREVHGRQIVVADPEDSEHVVYAFPVDADRLAPDELEVNQWQRCDFPFCPLALEHKGNHTPLNGPDEAADEDDDTVDEQPTQATCSVVAGCILADGHEDEHDVPPWAEQPDPGITAIAPDEVLGSDDEIDDKRKRGRRS